MIIRPVMQKSFFFSLYRYLFPVLVIMLAGLFLLLFILPASNVPA